MIKEIDITKTFETTNRTYNDPKELTSDNKCYKLALYLESQLKTMNFVLTLFGLICNFCEGFIVIIFYFHTENEMILIFKYFVFFKAISSAYMGYISIQLWRHRETSHPMNFSYIIICFIIVQVSLFSYEAPENNACMVNFVIADTVVDIVLLLICIAYICWMKIKARSYFKEKESFRSFATVLSIKLLRLFPIPDQMEADACQNSSYDLD
ncbi:unnamed protein product [Blepharisma stoltei]|uniref:Transmembrane protein n=1 Tax=Blepharisma stoltei TaxID=1481888 RepID=A0AAU9J2J2_9CILI|nr:unnamed protein product [Blepharisma stoltei]